MGLMDTVKGWFNIGGVKVQLEVASSVSRSGNELPGKITLTSKGDKHVLSVKCKLVEAVTTGRDDEEKTEEKTLGQTTISGEFDMKTGETKSFDFVMPYAIEERLADKKGALGAVGKLGNFASGTKIEYTVIAECDVKGTAFDPTAKQEMKVVD